MASSASRAALRRRRVCSQTALYPALRAEHLAPIFMAMERSRLRGPRRSFLLVIESLDPMGRCSTHDQSQDRPCARRARRRRAGRGPGWRPGWPAACGRGFPRSRTPWSAASACSIFEHLFHERQTARIHHQVRAVVVSSALPSAASAQCRRLSPHVHDDPGHQQSQPGQQTQCSGQ
jgi:hypothetical protein